MKSVAILCLACSLLFPFQTSAGGAEPIPVGVAKVDITPEHAGADVRLWRPEGRVGRDRRAVEGRGVGDRRRRGRRSGGAADASTAGRCPETIQPGGAARVCRPRLPLKPERFMLCNSHNHSGPGSEGHGRRCRAQSASTWSVRQGTDRAFGGGGRLRHWRRGGRAGWRGRRGRSGFAANRRVLKDGKWAGFGAVPGGCRRPQPAAAARDRCRRQAAGRGGQLRLPQHHAAGQLQADSRRLGGLRAGVHRGGPSGRGGLGDHRLRGRRRSGSARHRGACAGGTGGPWPTR